MTKPKMSTSPDFPAPFRLNGRLMWDRFDVENYERGLMGLAPVERNPRAPPTRPARGRLRPPFLRRIILIQPTRCKFFGPALIGVVGSHESLPLPPCGMRPVLKWGRGGGGFRAALFVCPFHWLTRFAVVHSVNSLYHSRTPLFIKLFLASFLSHSATVGNVAKRGCS
jgi:hypothetical protein